MQSDPRIVVNLLVILVKLLVNLLVKLTKLGIGGGHRGHGSGLHPGSLPELMGTCPTAEPTGLV